MSAHRILITAPSYLPHANGVAEVVSAHAEGLARRGHEVTVATAHDAARAESAPGDNPRVVQFKVAGDGSLKSLHRGEVKAYRDFVRGHPYDVAVCHCWQTWSTNLAAPLLRGRPGRGILVSHGYNAHRRPVTVRFPRGTLTLLSWMPYVCRMPALLRAFHHVVFLSGRVDRDRFFDHWVFRRLGLSAESVIPNGTYPDRFRSDPEAFRAAHGLAGRKVVLQVANYEEHKHQELSLQSFLAADCADSALVFVGHRHNDYSARLRARYREARAQGFKPPVLFLESLDKEAIRGAYVAADLFLCSSLTEVQPLVLLDAMAAGLPFISTRVGCVDELPGGQVVDSPPDMASAIRRLLGDEAARRALGRAGRAAAESRYHWERVLDRYEELFERLGRGPSA